MSGIRGASELADFILKNYSGKVVEVGAGFAGDVALRLLHLQSLNVIATDIEGRSIGRLHIEKDDIFAPREEIYEGASLLYSIRPPLEMQLAIGRLAQDIGADVIVRPLSDEVADLSDFSFTRSLINIGEARFYIFKRNVEGEINP